LAGPTGRAGARYVQGNLAILPAAVTGDFCGSASSIQALPAAGGPRPGDWRLPALAAGTSYPTDIVALPRRFFGRAS